jgi:anti-sigma B factor antagonist
MRAPACARPPGSWSRSDRGPQRRVEVAAPMEQPSTHVKIKREGDVAIVQFADRKILEELSIHEIGEELHRLAESQPNVKLLLDFGNVDHLASAALGMLITLHKKVQERNGSLKLSNINRQIYQVFKITRLNRVFEIHDTAEQALEAFAQA